MVDVFISNSRTDKLSAEKLSNELQSHGYDVWWDAALLGGDSFREAIQQKLSMAKVVLVIWTKDSIKSRFVVDEADEAAVLGKLVSITSENFAASSIPLGFRKFQSISISDNQKIAATLEQYVSSKAALHRSSVGRLDAQPTPEERAWDLIKSRQSLPLIKRFLQQYPNGKHSSNAILLRDTVTTLEVTNMIYYTMVPPIMFGFGLALGFAILGPKNSLSYAIVVGLLTMIAAISTKGLVLRKVLGDPRAVLDKQRPMT